MTITPDKKTSKSRTNRRTTNWIKLTARKLFNSVALNKEATGLSHFVAEDGTYKGRQVLRKKTKSKKVTRI
jgi:ribosomal protein L32